MNTQTLIAFEQQRTRKGGGNDLCICGVATFFCFMTNGFDQIICETVNCNNFIR
ncbi:MAG: hypothetical protein ICV79_27225 [Flavisolibacter sp.]|nr:hypothetical protein [Flavisolibacter sp.]